MTNDLNRLGNCNKDLYNTFLILDDIYRNKRDWYKNAQIVDSLTKEAGLRDIFTNIPLWLGIAVISVLTGSGIISTVQRYNLSQEQKQQLEKTLNNQEFISKIKNQMEDYKPTTPAIPTVSPINKPIVEPRKSIEPELNKLIEDARKSVYNKSQPSQKKNKPTKTHKIDTILPHLVEHEGLLPKQTPFRITHPDMKRWNNVMGFPVDKKVKVPFDRKKFIFLKNEEDVIPAVRKLFESYANNPEKYGLKSNVTLRQAIRKFDQTNSTHKLEYLRSIFPTLNFDRPLKYFF